VGPITDAVLRKIVLTCPNGATLRLEQLVEEFIQDGVQFVAVVGMECERVEDLIDEFVVGDGTRDPNRYILTSSHPNESVDDAVTFARSLTCKYAGEAVQVVELPPD
jgi:hypothetical protein